MRTLVKLVTGFEARWYRRQFRVAGELIRGEIFVMRISRAFGTLATGAVLALLRWSVSVTTHKAGQI
jgi:hypothetical protein